MPPITRSRSSRKGTRKLVRSQSQPRRSIDAGRSKSPLVSTNTIHDDLAEHPAAIYRIHPLGANSTRVLRVLPLPSTGPSDMISCRLSVIRLLGKPKYRALSYAWGDPSDTRLILVDDIPFRVRINLWNFLAQMRAEEYWGPLWIDAICINQESLKERGKQVEMMGQIYSKAAEVRAWLGTGNDRLMLAMLRLAQVDWSAVLKAVREDDTFLYRQPYSTNEWFAPICELSRVEYWSRLWVIQEFCLATRLGVQYGSILITANTLEDMHKSMFESRSVGPLKIGEQPDCERSVFDIESSPASHIVWTRLSMGRVREQTRLAPLLFRFRGSQCTDLHDHVYATLSLSGALSKAITPDYTKPLLQLFLDVTAQLREDYDCNDPSELLTLKLAAITLQEKLQLSRECAEVKAVLDSLSY